MIGTQELVGCYSLQLRSDGAEGGARRWFSVSVLLLLLLGIEGRKGRRRGKGEGAGLSGDARCWQRV